MQAINDFIKRNPRADGGSVNGSYEAALRKKIEELMDEGYEFGEAVREAMRQGYKYGGIAGLYQNKNGSFKLEISNKTAGVKVNEYYKASEKSKAMKRARAINKQIKNLTKGFLTRAELGKKIGVKASAIERYKLDKTDTYEKIKESNQLNRQDGGYAQSTAPVVSGDLMLDTKGDYSLKDNSVYIGWNAHANKIAWLRDMKPKRILTSKQYPINPDVVKKMMPQLNKELKKSMPKGTNTISIGKKK